MCMYLHDSTPQAKLLTGSQKGRGMVYKQSHRILELETAVVLILAKMKYFVVTVLVMFAAMLCIGHADGSKAMQVKKRQVPLPPEQSQEVCDGAEFQRRSDVLHCSNASVGQQRLNVHAECGDNGQALMIEQECGHNETGGFCFELRNNSTLNSLARLIPSICRSIFSRTSCSSFCNSTLRQLREGAGCCANYLITNAYVQRRQQAPPDLWSNCSLERPDVCPSALRFQQTQNERVCSQAEVTFRINRLSCNPDYITPVLNVMRNCGLEESAQGIINRCGVNRYGRFCFETERNVTFVLRQIQTSCFSDAETCPIFCRATLELFRTRAGCCLNNLYNNTSPALVRVSDYLATNHILWSSCGVESPGFCRNTIDNSQLQVSMNVTQSSYSVILQVSMTITGLCTILATLV